VPERAAAELTTLDRTLRGRLDAVMGASRLGMQDHERRLFDVRQVVLFGAGGSLYSDQVGAYLLNRYARLPAIAEDSAELLMQNPIVQRDTLYVAISQSGETADTLATAHELRVRGALVAVSPMLTVVPRQLYAYHTAAILGYDVDRPRNLAKSVTVL
jgi:glutamine---fructose-6-phosphate transaminase (isomerizing)